MRNKYIDRLISAALERYAEEDLLQSFLDKFSGWREKQNLLNVIKNDQYWKDEAKEVFEETMREENIIIHSKGLSLFQKERIREFLEAEIFTNYNEQTCINF